MKEQLKQSSQGKHIIDRFSGASSPPSSQSSSTNSLLADMSKRVVKCDKNRQRRSNIDILWATASNYALSTLRDFSTGLSKCLKKAVIVNTSRFSYSIGGVRAYSMSISGGGLGRNYFVPAAFLCHRYSPTSKRLRCMDSLKSSRPLQVSMPNIDSAFHRSPSMRMFIIEEGKRDKNAYSKLISKVQELYVNAPKSQLNRHFRFLIITPLSAKGDSTGDMRQVLSGTELRTVIKTLLSERDLIRVQESILRAAYAY